MALVILESEIGLSATEAAGISLPRDAAVTRMSNTSDPWSSRMLWRYEMPWQASTNRVKHCPIVVYATP